MTQAKHYGLGYSVMYNSSDHINVLFQMYGSVWPKVFPYVVVNMILAGIIQWLDSYESIDLGISDKGHSFMSMIVAFLVVSRVSMALARYNVARGHISTLYRTARELIQTMVLSTESQKDAAAQEWRHDMAYHTMLLVRLMMAVLDYNETKVATWDIPELGDEERKDILNNVLHDVPSDRGSSTSPVKKWAHASRSAKDENLRVPIWWEYRLKQTIMSQKWRLQEPVSPVVQGKMIGFVEQCAGGYYGLRQFLTTPTPFPLVQMCRTFLFFYLYTLPFALLKDTSNPIAHLCVIFIVTYGFLGLEYVAIEFDDPFGNDDNDFDNLGMATTMFEDTYLIMHDVDGEDCADKLRKKMKSHAEMEGDVHPERRWLLGSFLASAN